MSAAELDVHIETESERIERWRAEELERAGYDGADAVELAARGRTSISTSPSSFSSAAALPAPRSHPPLGSATAARAESLLPVPYSLPRSPRRAPASSTSARCTSTCTG